MAIESYSLFLNSIDSYVEKPVKKMMNLVEFYNFFLCIKMVIPAMKYNIKNHQKDQDEEDNILIKKIGRCFICKLLNTEIVLPQCCHALCSICFDKLKLKNMTECPECSMRLAIQCGKQTKDVFELIDPREGNIDIEINDKITNAIHFIINYVHE